MGKGFDTFMENPYWRNIYENATSENLKEYYRLMFDYNSFVSEREIPEKIMDRLSELWLSEEDIKFLLNHAGMNMAKHTYSKYLAAMKEKPSGTCVAAIACLGEIRNPYYIPPK